MQRLAQMFVVEFFAEQRKTLLALEKEDEEERNKTIESLKTALRTQPMRSFFFTFEIQMLLHLLSFDLLHPVCHSFQFLAAVCKLDLYSLNTRKGPCSVG